MPATCCVRAGFPQLDDGSLVCGLTVVLSPTVDVLEGSPLSMEDVAVAAPHVCAALNKAMAAKMAEMAAELTRSRKRARLA